MINTFNVHILDVSCNIIAESYDVVETATP